MFLAPLLLACTPSGELVLDSGDSTVDTGTPDPLVLEWTPCDLRPGTGDRGAECTWVDLPMDHGAPDGGKLPALVKRRPGTGSGQAWLMHGGPGGSAVDDLYYLPSGLAAARPDLTLYAIDHRGIGGTARLGCEDESSMTDSDWPECVAALQEQWGDDLDQFTTTNSAHDVGWLIEGLAEPDEEVFVYGGSYGTYLALRYLQLYPDQPTGVVLDGISPPGDGFVGYDVGMDGAGHDLMALCGEDPDCAAHFDDDPWTVAQDLIDKVDEGHCPALNISGDFVRYFLGTLLFYDKLRDLVPATVHRFDRCSAEDVDVIVTLYYAVNGSLGGSLARPIPARLRGLEAGSGNEGKGFSYALFFHIALSEMWYGPDEASATDFLETWKTLTMSTGLETWLANKVDWWPSFPKDEYWRGVADYEGPLLMLQGGLDPATTPGPALTLAEHFGGPAQTLAYFPEGAHGLINGTTLPDGSNCGDFLFQAFLEDPEGELDLSCIEDTLGVQWDGYPTYNQYFMGTDDIWGEDDR